METGQTGAQTQIDVNHSTTIYLGAVSTFTFGGAKYVMKRGSSSTDDVTFSLYANSTCTGTPLRTVTNSSIAFSQNFATVQFQIPGNISLSPGIYCTRVTSNAADQQNTAFFIKGYETCVVLPASEANGAICSTTIPTLAPNLTLTKSAPSPSLIVGKQSTYQLTVTNSGNMSASNPRVLDRLPTGLSFASVSGTGWGCSNSLGLLTCDLTGTIAPGGTSTLNITVSVDPGTAGQTLTNFASVDPAGRTSPPTPGASCTPSASCASSSGTVTSPNLTISKSAPVPTLKVGAQSTYTLSVTNTGTAAMATARVLDQLPTGLTFQSFSGQGWSCSAVSGLITCNYSGRLGASGSGTNTTSVNLTVAADTGTGGQSLTNFASIDPLGGTSPPTPGASCSPSKSCASNSSTVTAPNLTISKSAPSPALKVGKQSIYTLTVTNTGTAAATTARVLDQLPTGLSLVSATGVGWNCTNASGLVTCNFSGSISAGSGVSTISVVVTADAGTAGSSLTNRTTIDPTGGPNPPTPGTCTPSTTCGTNTSTVSAPNLTLSKSAPTPSLKVGVQSTYVLAVTNTGAGAATTAQVLDQLPAGLTFDSAIGAGWVCGNAAGLVTCNFSGTINASGGTSTINVLVTPNAGTAGQTLVNHASVDPTGGPNPPTPGPACTTANCGNNSSTVSAANLTIGKSAPTPALTVGAQSTYALTVTNTGAAATAKATVQDKLPTGLAFNSAASGTSGITWTCSETSGTVSCVLASGTIAADGGSAVINVTATANAGTGGQTLVNYASVDQSGGPSPPTPGPSCAPSTSCASSSGTVSAANLSLAKGAPTPGLQVGAQSTYQLTVTNNGAAPASSATVREQLPTGLTFVSATGAGWSCTDAFGLITCNFSGSIAAGGGTSAVSIRVGVNAGTAGQTLVNHASIDPTGGPNPPPPGTSCTTSGSCASSTGTVSAPNLSLAKGAPTPGLKVGAQSTYLLTVTNSGSAAAASATVRDQLPTGLTFVSATGAGWSCTDASGLITCNFSGSIAAGGGTSAVSIRVGVNAGTAGQTLVNHASIDPTGGPNPPPPGTSCTTSGSCSSSGGTVTEPVLKVHKAAPTPGLEVGLRSTYVLTVTNTGGFVANSATVQDKLPDDLTFVSAGGAGWVCSVVNGLIACDYSGSLAAGGGITTINVVVTPLAQAAGKTVINYASIDTSGGKSPPMPGPSCAPSTSCSSVSSRIGSAKRRTEAIVHNFLAKRADRIANNGLDLNRLVSRLSDECVAEEPNSSSGSSWVARITPATNDRRLDTRISEFSYAAMPPGQETADAPRVDERRLQFGSGLGAAVPQSGWNAMVEKREAVESRQQPVGLGPVAAGDEDSGSINLSASLIQARKMYATNELARTGYRRQETCAERRRSNNFDIWFEGTLDYFKYPGARGSFSLFKFGADYRITPGLLLGALVQLDHTSDKSESMGYLVKGNGWMAGLYTAMRLDTNLYFDARVMRGMSDNEVSPYMTYSDHFVSDRLLAAARVSGRWQWDNLTVTPSVEYIYFRDQSKGYIDTNGIPIDSQRVTINRLIFGSEFRYATSLGAASTLGLHFSAKGLWDADPIALKALDDSDAPERRSNLHARFELGATIATRSGVSADVTVAYEGLGGDGFEAKSITGRLKIPVQ